MSTQGLQILDQATQVTHEWINELAGRLDWSSRRDTLRLLRAVLRQLRDHLQIDEVAQFSAQLPLLIRGMFFEGWRPKRTPIKQRREESFVQAIEASLGEAQEYRGSQDIRTVFSFLNERVSAGEVDDVRAALPSAIRALWREP